MYHTEAHRADFKPGYFESDGQITLKGQVIPYHTVCEDNVFYAEDGHAIASVFSYSYFRSDITDNSDRPVLFGFNGGPGSASMYVHAGLLGPDRISYKDEADRKSSLPPYPMMPNEDCLLDMADIVIFEPVGVGYGLLLDDSKKDQFYGIEEDAEALLCFIEKWCRTYNRFSSPKYLLGESYGTTRAVTAAGMSVSGGKDRAYGIRFDGLILIGTTVTPGQFFAKDLPVPLSVIRFPTYASIHWYHNHPTAKSLEDFAMEAKRFADRDYLLALYEGEGLKGEEREKIIEKIIYYTGVSREFLERYALEIPENEHRSEVLKNKGLAVGRCDGRFTRPLYRPITAEYEENHGFYDDASMDSYDSYYYAAMAGYLTKKLNINLNRAYVSTAHMEDWNMDVTGGTTAERLRNAMNKTFGMRTFFANGWYDACTEIGFVFYTLNHAGLPTDRITVKGYPSGHMIYIGDENLKELAGDIRTFMEGK